MRSGRNIVGSTVEWVHHGGYALPRQQIGEGCVEDVFERTAFGKIVKEERGLGVERVLDLRVAKPYEVLEAHMQHLRTVNRFNVEEDGNRLNPARRKRGPDVPEESRVDQALRCRTKVVGVELGSGMYSRSRFKLGLGIGSGMVKDDLRRGIGHLGRSRNCPSEKDEGKTAQQLHLQSILGVEFECCNKKVGGHATHCQGSCNYGVLGPMGAERRGVVSTTMRVSLGKAIFWPRAIQRL